MNSKTDRCAGSLKDGSPCRSVVVRDESDELSAFCSHHLKLSQASPAPVLAMAPDAGEIHSEAVSLSGATASENPQAEQERESAPIASIRQALKGDLSTSSVADSIAELLLEGLRASKEVFTTCPSCNKRHPVSLPDLGTRISAARALMEELEGKLAQQAKSAEDRISEALAGKVGLSELTNDELLLLVHGGDDGDFRSDAQEIARRVLREAA